MRLGFTSVWRQVVTADAFPTRSRVVPTTWGKMTFSVVQTDFLPSDGRSAPGSDRRSCLRDGPRDGFWLRGVHSSPFLRRFFSACPYQGGRYRSDPTGTNSRTNCGQTVQILNGSSVFHRNKHIPERTIDRLSKFPIQADRGSCSHTFLNGWYKHIVELRGVFQSWEGGATSARSVLWSSFFCRNSLVLALLSRIFGIASPSSTGIAGPSFCQGPSALSGACPFPPGPGLRLWLPDSWHVGTNPRTGKKHLPTTGAVPANELLIGTPDTNVTTKAQQASVRLASHCTHTEACKSRTQAVTTTLLFTSCPVQSADITFQLPLL